jgi:hypothetical protein
VEGEVCGAFEKDPGRSAQIDYLVRGRSFVSRLSRLSLSGWVKLSSLREAFVRNKHPRFKKEFASSRHQPFGLTSDYIKGIENADSEKLARLIKIVGMLLQTKVYLFWEKDKQ